MKKFEFFLSNYLLFEFFKFILGKVVIFFILDWIYFWTPNQQSVTLTSAMQICFFKIFLIVTDIYCNNYFESWCVISYWKTYKHFTSYFKTRKNNHWFALVKFCWHSCPILVFSFVVYQILITSMNSLSRIVWSWWVVQKNHSH